MIQFENTFHRTSVNVKAKPGDKLSPSQLRRIRRALCGVSGCHCGDQWGVRGGRYHIDFAEETVLDEYAVEVLDDIGTAIQIERDLRGMSRNDDDFIVVKHIAEDDTISLSAAGCTQARSVEDWYYMEFKDIRSIAAEYFAERGGE